MLNLGTIAVAIFLNPALLGAYGGIVVILTTLFYGMKGGTASAIWNSLIMLVMALFNLNDATLHSVFSGIIIYLLAGAGVGWILDRNREQKKKLEEEIKKRIEAEETNEQSRERFFQLFNSLVDAVMIFGYQKESKKFLLLEYNDAARKMKNLVESDLGKDTESLCDMINDCNINEEIMNVKETGQTYNAICSFTDSTGKKKWRDINIIRITDYEIAVIVSDITNRKNAEKRIKYLTFHDQLTGLANRMYLKEKEDVLADGNMLPLSVIMADLNGLKVVNDTFGHHEGDRYIKKAASILSKASRKEDLVARVGGDEFIMILPGTEYSDAMKVIDRIDRECRNTHISGYPVDIALGAATKRRPSDEFDAVVKEADMRMYEDKKEKKSGIKKHIR